MSGECGATRAARVRSRVLVCSGDVTEGGSDRDVIDGARLVLHALDLARAGASRAPTLHAGMISDGAPVNEADPPEIQLASLAFNVAREELLRRRIPMPMPAGTHRHNLLDAEAEVRAALVAGAPWRTVDLYGGPNATAADVARGMLNGGQAAHHSKARNEAVRFVHRAMRDWVETWQRPRGGRGGRGGGKRPIGPPVMEAACVVVLAPLLGMRRATRCIDRLRTTDDRGRPSSWMAKGAGRHGWPITLTQLVLGSDLGLTEDGVRNALDGMLP